VKWLVAPREAIAVWTKIGLLSFGGPAGQIALMHRIFVEEKRWIGETRYLHALNLCMLLPGPEAQQLATYIGWLIGGVRGGIAAGTLFVAPGAIVMMGLSILYARFAELPLLQGVFYGVKAAVVAVVVEALLRIGKRALKTNFSRALAALAFVGIFFFAVPFPLIVLLAGIIGALNTKYFASAPKQTSAEKESEPLIDAALDANALPHTAPKTSHTIITALGGLFVWFAPLVLLVFATGSTSPYAELGWFFSKMAVVTFGGAYAVLAYVADQAVNAHHWLAPAQMLHGLGLAETTPGPLILVLQFVGFLTAYRPHDSLAAGMFGASIALWATFVPSILWILVGAPYTEALRRIPALTSALAAITAAIVGVILNLTVWFAIHALFGAVGEAHFGPLRTLAPAWSSFDAIAALIAAFAAIAMLRLHWGMLPVLGLCAAAGTALSLAGTI
jgi:chromate transporter